MLWLHIVTCKACVSCAISFVGQTVSNVIVLFLLLIIILLLMGPMSLNTVVLQGC